LAEASTVAAIKLLGVKVSFERLARFMSAIEAEGTYRGMDIYEVMQGVHDSVSAALSYLVTSKHEAEMRKAGMCADDREFEAMVSEIEGGGHG
jgi:hypothetical protein